MHFVCSYTSGYFPIYDDEYEHVYYDDDDDGHALHDTQWFADIQTLLQIASLNMMSLGGCEPPGDLSSHVWVMYREVLHIQFCSDWRSPL